VGARAQLPVELVDVVRAAAWGGYLEVTAMGAGAKLHLGMADVCLRRSRRAP
jgi:hypothetical protein